MSKTIKVMRQALEVLKTLKVTEGYDQYKNSQLAIAALDEVITAEVVRSAYIQVKREVHEGATL